jgi:hypothetical protein
LLRQVAFGWASLVFFDVSSATPECLLKAAALPGEILLYVMPALMVLVPILLFCYGTCYKCCVTGNQRIGTCLCVAATVVLSVAIPFALIGTERVLFLVFVAIFCGAALCFCCCMFCSSCPMAKRAKEASAMTKATDVDDGGKGKLKRPFCMNADAMEDKLTTFFASIFGTLIKLALFGISYGGGVSVIAGIILGLTGSYMLYLLRAVRGISNSGGRFASKHDKGRLENRTKYLISCYGDHAQYWQFVVWGRQLSLTAFAGILSRSSAYLQVGLPLAEMVVLILMQWKFHPYDSKAQNQLELGGLMVSTLIMAMSMGLEASKSAALDVAMFAVFVVLWLSLVAKFWQAPKASPALPHALPEQAKVSIKTPAEQAVEQKEVEQSV